MLCTRSKDYEDKERKPSRYSILELYETLGKLSIYLDLQQMCCTKACQDALTNVWLRRSKNNLQLTPQLISNGVGI